MENKKRWLTVVRTDQYTWLKEQAKSHGIKGSDLLGEALDRIIKDKEFLETLAETQLKIQLQKLNDEAAEIEEKREQVRRTYKEVTGKERVRV